MNLREVVAYLSGGLVVAGASMFWRHIGAVTEHNVYATALATAICIAAVLGVVWLWQRKKEKP